MAPFAGRLGIRKVDVGQYVAAGAPMVSLQQLDPIYLDFQVPEQNYVNLAVGRRSRRRGRRAWPARRFHGKISNFDARVDRDTRTILVRAEIANPDKKIMPGMFADVDLDAGSAAEDRHRAAHRDRLFALWRFGFRRASRTIAAKGFDGPLHVERRIVSIGEAREDRVVLLEGVAAGEKVVTAGQIKLQPNAPVRIEPDKAMKPLPVRPAP